MTGWENKILNDKTGKNSYRQENSFGGIEQGNLSRKWVYEKLTEPFSTKVKIPATSYKWKLTLKCIAANLVCVLTQTKFITISEY
jgi:hypothetical protein